MAEIKSTMDLIMEKTRHLSMTEDEKKEKRQQDARQELQGLICKIEDKTIKTTEFEKSYETIKSTYHDGQAVDVDAMLRDELINRLDLDADNTARLQLIGRYFNIDTQQFFELFSAYNTALDHARQTRDGIPEQSGENRIRPVLQHGLRGGTGDTGCIQALRIPADQTGHRRARGSKVARGQRCRHRTRVLGQAAQPQGEIQHHDVQD